MMLSWGSLFRNWEEATAVKRDIFQSIKSWAAETLTEELDAISFYELKK